MYCLTVKVSRYKLSVYFHNSNMFPPLKKTFENLGLSEKQIAVLSVLLENGGSMLVTSIGKAAKLNRTTTYDILRELVAKGLASQVKKDGAFRYQSIAPESLPAYVERQREILEESKKEIAELIPQIKLLRSKGRSVPKVQFFEGVEGVRQAYEDILENNPEKFLRGITGMDAVYSNLDETWLEYFLKKRTRLGIRCVDLAPETEGGKRSKADDERFIRTTKFLPPQYNFEGDISIYSNKVAIFSYDRENPVGIIIEDDAIAYMMKQFFDFASSVAK